jgi:TM2 domain-containing membrane protein YozV
MKQIILAVLLSGFVWPGAGQIYNREFQKGLVLIALTILFGFSLFLGAGSEILKNLPADLSKFDILQARQLSEELLRKNSKFILTFNILMTTTWIYSVVDAYWGAKERWKANANPEKPADPSSDEGAE